jgi:hypothetical protein
MCKESFVSGDVWFTIDLLYNFYERRVIAWVCNVKDKNDWLVDNVEMADLPSKLLNRSVAFTWVMFQSHRAGKMRTNGIFLFLLRLLDPEINRLKKYRSIVNFDVTAYAPVGMPGQTAHPIAMKLCQHIACTPGKVVGYFPVRFC